MKYTKEWLEHAAQARKRHSQMTAYRTVLASRRASELERQYAQRQMAAILASAPQDLRGQGLQLSLLADTEAVPLASAICETIRAHIAQLGDIDSETQRELVRRALDIVRAK